MNLLLDSVCKGATFSKDRVYRYRLWRTWGDKTRMCNFVMLNPSTADERDNDPTVERCERRARAWGYGGLIVTNIFALRATDPAVMMQHSDPVGASNDAYLVSVARTAALVVCAWGAFGAHRSRSMFVRKLLADSGAELYCLGTTGIGEPRHPLYVPYVRQPILL